MEQHKYQTLYFAARTFFTMTKLTSRDALGCNTPPIAVTNVSILTWEREREREREREGFKCK